MEENTRISEQPLSDAPFELGQEKEAMIVSRTWKPDFPDPRSTKNSTFRGRVRPRTMDVISQKNGKFRIHQRIMDDTIGDNDFAEMWFRSSNFVYHSTAHGNHVVSADFKIKDAMMYMKLKDEWGERSDFKAKLVCQMYILGYVWVESRWLHLYERRTYKDLVGPGVAEGDDSDNNPTINRQRIIETNRSVAYSNKSEGSSNADAELRKYAFEIGIHCQMRLELNDFKVRDCEIKVEGALNRISFTSLPS